MMSLPISVIIIAKDAEDTIEDCLSSVQQNAPAEIILIDGNSSDRTVEIAQGYTDRIHSDEGKGKSFARQLGAEVATEEYIAYVDSDVTLTQGALETMLAEFRGSGYVSINAQVLPGAKCRNYWGWAGWQHSQYSQLRRSQGYLGLMTCLLKKETILKYRFDYTPGGYLDDTLLESKLKKEGRRFGVSSAISYHNHKMDLKSFVRYRFFLGRLMPSLIGKLEPWHVGFWPPLATLYWLAFCMSKGKPKLIPYFIVDGVAKTAGMVKGFFELVMGRA